MEPLPLISSADVARAEFREVVDLLQSWCVRANVEAIFLYATPTISLFALSFVRTFFNRAHSSIKVTFVHFIKVCAYCAHSHLNNRRARSPIITVDFYFRSNTKGEGVHVCAYVRAYVGMCVCICVCVCMCVCVWTREYDRSTACIRDFSHRLKINA